jgi:hypothetical protein
MKYYVSSGNLRVVICNDKINNHLDAAINVLLLYLDEFYYIDKDIVVSEIGFSKHNEDKVFDTASVIRKAGIELE